MDAVVCDGEVLVRMTFYPEHYTEDGFLPSAVSLDDLKERGVSVDRLGITKRSVIEHRIVEQSKRHPDAREDAIFSRLVCGELRAETHDCGTPAFLISATPMDDNLGHASITSFKSLGKGELRKLRTRLLTHMASIVALDDLHFTS